MEGQFEVLIGTNTVVDGFFRGLKGYIVDTCILIEPGELIYSRVENNHIMNVVCRVGPNFRRRAPDGGSSSGYDLNVCSRVILVGHVGG